MQGTIVHDFGPSLRGDREAVAEVTGKRPSSPPVPRPGLSALIVDDDPEIRDMLSLSLGLEGFDVWTAADGAAALEAIRAKPVDLVLLDVMMPTLNGYDVMDRLRAEDEGRSLPVILLTAKAGDRDVWEGWARGADSYMTKPIDLDLLLSEIARVTAASDAT